MKGQKDVNLKNDFCANLVVVYGIREQRNILQLNF